MTGRAAWKRWGVAVAAVLLSLAVLAPEVAAPAGAAVARPALAARRSKKARHHHAKHHVKRHKVRHVHKRRHVARHPRPRRRPSTAASRAAVARSRARATKARKVMAALAFLAKHPNYRPKKHKAKKPVRARAHRKAHRRRTKRVTRLGALAAARRRKDGSKPAKTVTTHRHLSLLSFAGIGLVALMPFVAIGLALIGSDYLRRRTPKVGTSIARS